MELAYSAVVSTAHGVVKLSDFISHMTILRGWEKMMVKISMGKKTYVFGRLEDLWSCWISPGCIVEVER